jgi:D-glycero-D-manno-heptose 1,7-bisphosphate phosphatase
MKSEMAATDETRTEHGQKSVLDPCLIRGSDLRKAVFLDRDGVLIACVVRNGKPYPPMRMEEVEILPGVAEAIRRLAAAGYILVGASNQPDVGRGTIPREFVEAVNRRLLEQLPEIREIDACYDFDDANPRRKPNPGMLLDAGRKYNLNLTASFMVGDRAKDIEAGRRADCRTVFIDHGYHEPRPKPAADFTTHSLLEAAGWILKEKEQKKTEETENQVRIRNPSHG